MTLILSSSMNEQYLVQLYSHNPKYVFLICWNAITIELSVLRLYCEGFRYSWISVYLKYQISAFLHYILFHFYVELLTHYIIWISLGYVFKMFSNLINYQPNYTDTFADRQLHTFICLSASTPFNLSIIMNSNEFVVCGINNSPSDFTPWIRIFWDV